MIQPSALNVLIIGLSVVIFSALWRIIAMKLADTTVGEAMAVVL
jgi:hypothetical protein